MGWFDGLRLASDAARGVTLRRPSAIASPWADSSSLEQMFVATDLFGTMPRTFVDEHLCMTIPAVVKARSVLHSVIGSRSLVQVDLGETLTPTASQPTWLYRSDTGVTPIQRNKAILDDFLFRSATLIAFQRGSKQRILDAARVHPSRWSVNKQGVILVDGDEVEEGDVAYIPGPWGGAIDLARRLVIASIDTDEAWSKRVESPLPGMLLQEVEDNGMTPLEMTEWVTAVAKARRNGSVMGIPAKLNATFPGTSETDLFASGRNAIRLDWANFLAMPASILDGSVAAASLTYSTEQGKHNEFYDYSVPYWASPLEQGLSIDSVTPRGSGIRFNFKDFLSPVQADQGTPIDDNAPDAEPEADPNATTTTTATPTQNGTQA